MTSVTVVVPTYNRAQLLDLTLNSILAQTTPALEVIVVDDGSTDETAAVCASKAGAVRYVRQENTGRPAFGRNRGFAEAMGDWVALCDSDDIWHPNKLELQLASIKATGAAWSVSGFGLIDDAGERIPTEDMGFEREFPVFRGGAHPSSQHFSRWLSASSVRGVEVFFGDAFGMLFEGNVCLTSSALISKKLVDRAGGFDTAFALAEDTEFFHRLAAHAPVAIVMSRLLDYRVGHPSMMSVRDLSPAIRLALESLRRASELRGDLTTTERSAYQRGRERLRLRLAYERLSSLDPGAARAALRDGWRLGDAKSLRAVALWSATFVPLPVLRGAHWTKRAILSGIHKPSRELRVRGPELGPKVPDSAVESSPRIGE